MRNFSERVESFGRSTIDAMTDICFRYGGVMLAAGTPGFDTPDALKRIACKYLNNGHNQYTVNRGSSRLRDTIVHKWRGAIGRELDVDDEVTVTCGATEALLVATMATVNPGDAVIVMEPFYENYRSITFLSEGVPRYVPLLPLEWEPDWDMLSAAARGAKLLIINSPHNPTGSVLSEKALKKVAKIAVENDLFVISDETYRTMVYDIAECASIASFPGMAERTVVIGSFSKIMTATGWRVGFAIAGRDFTTQLRKVHDFASICAPAPFQDATAEFLESLEYEPYFNEMMMRYRLKRDILCDTLEESGFCFTRPDGAYYILADFSSVNSSIDDFQMVEFMAKDVGVCAIGGRAFFNDTKKAAKFIRLSFARELEEIKIAVKRITDAFVNENT